MDKIKCLHPVFILNPKFVYELPYSVGYYYKTQFFPSSTFNKERLLSAFPYKRFAKLRHFVTYDDLDNCFCIDQDGVIVPMFIAVPCGKCDVCKEQKSKDWSIRALLESQTHTNPPVFLTLTYNDKHLPKDGVNKRDIQLFLKRLRASLSIWCNCKLRYFFVSEYGSLHGRPHYHALLWGLPDFVTGKQLIEELEKAWSICINKKEQLYEQIGFVYCPYARDGSGKYVMKYMSKPNVIVPNGKNPTFYTCSRRPGIGFNYLVNHKDEYLRNLDTFVFKVTDKFNPDPKYQVVYYSLPKYFKDYLFPSPCKLVTKDLRDSMKLYLFLKHQHISLQSLWGVPNVRINTSDFDLIRDYAHALNVTNYLSNYKDWKYFLSLSHNQQSKYLHELEFTTSKMFCILKDSLSYIPDIDKRLKPKLDRLKYLSQIKFDEINLEFELRKIERKRIKYLQNELF